MSAESKIAELKKRVAGADWEDSARDDVQALERAYGEALAAAGLLDHFIIKDFLATVRTRIAALTQALSETEVMTLEVRQAIFTKRGVLREFLDLFDGAEIRLKNVEKKVDDALEQAKNEDGKQD